MFKECFALEKIHGTSSHIHFKMDILSGNPGTITFFSGGAPFQNFVTLFNVADLLGKFTILGHPDVVAYGEAYGGKEQGMSHTYGKELKFIVFDVKIGEHWLNVTNAEDVAKKLGLEFVHYNQIPTTLEAIDAERDAPSVQAVRNGILEPKKREGVVLRPLQEFYVAVSDEGEAAGRVICKHKGAEFSETSKERKVVDPEQLEVLSKAREISDEWVTEMRLEHVLQKFPNAELKDIPQIIEAMKEDVLREAKGEIIESKDLGREISRKTAVMFKKRIQDSLYSNNNISQGVSNGP